MSLILDRDEPEPPVAQTKHDNLIQFPPELFGIVRTPWREWARMEISSSPAHKRAMTEGRSRCVEAIAGLPLLDGRTISNVSVLENDSKDVGAFSVLGSIGKEQLPAGHNVASTDFNSLQCPVNQDSQITRASGRQGTKDLKSPPEQIDTDAKFGNCANRAGGQVSSRINRCVATPVVSTPTFQSAVPLDFTHSHKGQLTTLAGTSNGSPNGRSAHNRIIPLLREKEQEFVQLIPRTDEDDSSDADGFLPAKQADAGNEATLPALTLLTDVLGSPSESRCSKSQLANILAMRDEQEAQDARRTVRPKEIA